MNNFFAMSYSSYPHFSTGPGYDDLAYIANLEGLTGRYMPALPTDRRLNVILGEGTLASRINNVSTWKYFEKGCVKWPHGLSDYRSISKNVGRLRDQKSLEDRKSISVRSASEPAESKLATLDRARRVLDRIDRTYGFADQTETWEQVIEGLLQDSIVEELTIMVMQQTANYLGRCNRKLDGVPKSIMECENLLNRV
ncbi:hypothetical protein ACCO45_012860 [Purpureocillium lilacinum]|uniref:Uncharacterized protein n=3 Tax=Purpureocillium lilacinum TaxID=33203 RepID=A0ACC4D9V6_PURLI|nr:hypothetical protein Purlil1_7709 [Purpureocillium lilacinum]